MKRIAWVGMGLISIGLIVGNITRVIQFDWVEILGFITGMASVWLAVKNSPSNWPVGIVESAAYLIVFFTTKLYANSFLQFLFIVISLWGWYQWLRGGVNATPRPIAHLPKRTALILLIILPISTNMATVVITAVEGSAPFWDTLTTVLSLIATYVMGKRFIENWFIWITADVVYIALFASRALYLTSVLYMLFLLMCLRGHYEWRQTLKKTSTSSALAAKPDHPLLAVP